MDLFAGECERLPLADADIVYLPRLELPEPAGELLDRLRRDIAWREQEIVVWGKTHLQPRLVAWYGDARARYTYSGIELEPLPWTPLLLAVKHCVERAAEADFNSVLLNYYRNHRDSMGMHSDDEPELGPRPTIASLSLGEERTLVLKHRRNRALAPARLKLACGSLLLMRGATQANWRHGINKLTRPCGPRINLTFRQIVPTETHCG